MHNAIDEDKIKHIENNIRSQMKKKRFLHTLGVMEASATLAKKNGADIYKTAAAALLHDYAKDFDKEQLMVCVKKYKIEIDPIMKYAHQLLHGKVAAAIATHEFGIEDDEVLLAIEYHTTGRRGMGMIEKIIYLSDFIEPGREYTGVDALRKLASEDLDKAVLQALTNTMIYVLRTGKLLHPNTLEARNEMLMD